MVACYTRGLREWLVKVSGCGREKTWAQRGSSPIVEIESTASPIRILVADDHELVLHGIAAILTRAHPDWEIVGLASSGTDAVEMGRLLRPGLAVLDLAMPDQTGLDVA